MDTITRGHPDIPRPFPLSLITQSHVSFALTDPNQAANNNHVNSVSEGLPESGAKTFYENLPFHGIQAPPNKVSVQESIPVCTNDNRRVDFKHGLLSLPLTCSISDREPQSDANGTKVSRRKDTPIGIVSLFRQTESRPAVRTVACDRNKTIVEHLFPILFFFFYSPIALCDSVLAISKPIMATLIKALGGGLL